MNINFKNEFAKIDKNELINIINGYLTDKLVRDHDLLSTYARSNIHAYTIEYVEDDKYGKYVVNWNWSRIQGFCNDIEICPFKVTTSRSTHERLRSRPDYEIYANIDKIEKSILKYIAQSCPHFVYAYHEEKQQELDEMLK